MLFFLADFPLSPRYELLFLSLNLQIFPHARVPPKEKFFAIKFEKLGGLNEWVLDCKCEAPGRNNVELETETMLRYHARWARPIIRENNMISNQKAHNNFLWIRNIIGQPKYNLMYRLKASVPVN